jgi:hypothetical protein
MRGIPTRAAWDTSYSIAYALAYYQADSSQRPYRNTATQYNEDYMGGFSPQRFPGTRFLVTYMNMGSVAATEAYIDKLGQMYAAMATPSVVITAPASREGTYYVDDVRNSGYFSIMSHVASAVMAENPSASVIYNANAHISFATNVSGYTSWGYNGGLTADYPNDGEVSFTGSSSWYVIRTIESFNGQVDQIWPQGNFVKWWEANAFGGAGYSNTPVGAVCHVEEPGIVGTPDNYVGPNHENYFAYWERGNLFIEAAWASMGSAIGHSVMMAVGDPLVAKSTH